MAQASPIRRPARLTAEKTRLAAEIREQLRAQGGAAHREVVIDRILQRKGCTGPAAIRTRKALLSAFAIHLDPGDTQAPRLFDLPFGPDSYRWALDEQGRSAIPFQAAARITSGTRRTSSPARARSGWR